MTIDNQYYLKALKSQPVKDVEIKTSKRREVLKKQDNRCIKCKKDLSPYMTKYITKSDGTMEAICSNCAIPTPKR